MNMASLGPRGKAKFNCLHIEPLHEQVLRLCEQARASTASHCV